MKKESVFSPWKKSFWKRYACTDVFCESDNDCQIQNIRRIPNTDLVEFLIVVPKTSLEAVLKKLEVKDIGTLSGGRISSMLVSGKYDFSAPFWFYAQYCRSLHNLNTYALLKLGTLIQQTYLWWNTLE